MYVGVLKPEVSLTANGNAAFLWEWDEGNRNLDLEVLADGTINDAFGNEKNESRDDEGRTQEEAVQSKWTSEKNHRRCELVDKEIEGTLWLAEEAELEILQGEMLAHRRKVAPLPLSDLRELHQELLQKFHEQSE